MALASPETASATALPPSTDALRASYTKALSYVRGLFESGVAQREDVSELWAGIFAESDVFPDFERMLVLRRALTMGVGDMLREPSDLASVRTQREYADAAWWIAGHSLPAGFLERFEESSLGAPVCFEYAGRTVSAGAIVNSLTSHRIVEWCDRLGLDGRPLRVLEIGAGYGQVAHQLLQQLDIESYVVCDLAQNLLLSAFYLQANHPDRSVSFLGDAGELEAAGLCFLPPAFLQRAGSDYDVILNSYSFQEMTQSAVDGYFSFAASSLGEDGFLYSLNAHGIAGVRRPSDYPMDQLSLAGLTPVRRYPLLLFATTPYELVARRADGDRPAVEGAAERALDAFGMTMQLGIHDELEAAGAELSAGRPPAWLVDLAELFEPGDAAVKRRAIAAAEAGGAPRAITSYLRGVVDFATGAEEAEATLAAADDALADSLARALARMMRAAIAIAAGNLRRGRELTGRAAELAPHLEHEIWQWANAPAGWAAEIGRRVSLDAAAIKGPPASRVARTAMRARRARVILERNGLKGLVRR